MAGSAVIGALRVNLGVDTAAFSDGLKKANAGITRFGKVMKVGLLAAATAATGAIAGMSMAIKGTINTADEMSKAAKKIGVPIEELSRLRYAADLSGVSFEGLQNGVKRLSANMYDAGNGTGEATKAFADLGITVKNADGSLKSSSEVMAELADRFQAMPDGAEKTALAMRVFGKAGADMIPLLNGGGEALRSLMNEADKFGQVFTQEMGTQAENFNDNMSRLKGAFAAVAAQLAQAVLPYLEKFSAWLVDNAPAIGAAVKGMLDFAAATIQLGSDIIGFVTGAWAMFTSAWDAAVAKVEAVKMAVITFGNEMVSSLTGMVERFTEIGSAIITGLWNGITSKFASVRDGLVNFATGMVDSVKSKLGIHSPSTVMHEVGTNIMGGLYNGMDSMASDISDLASNIGSTIGSAFSGVIDGSKSVQDALRDVLKSLAQMAANSLFQQLGGGAMGGVGGFLGSLFGGLAGFRDGGSFKVGGSGGIDSQIAAFRVTPNETVTVTKPGQMAGAAAGGALEIWLSPELEGRWLGNAAQQTVSIVRRAAPGIASAGAGKAQQNFVQSGGWNPA